MTSAQYQVLDESQPMEDLNKTNDLEITTTEYFEVERKRGVYRLSVLQLIIRSLILIRACSVLVALASFILITYSVATFKQADNAGRVRDENGQKVSVKTQPAVTFSGIGGASFFLSLLILLGCWKSKKMRTINVLTNAVFAVIGCVGFAAWMGGCFYLGRSSLASVPLWHWACDQKQHPTVANFNSAAVCYLSTCSWSLGILQAAFDLLTLLNVMAACLILKWATFRRFGYF